MKPSAYGRVEILVVEDSLIDARLITDALKEGEVAVRLSILHDGDAALSFLRRDGAHTDAPRPELVLLDLNLPGRSGHEVLAEIRSDPELHRIPVVVLTSSTAEQDVLRSYDLCANSHVIKPTDPDDFHAAIRAIGHYWLATVRLPAL